MVTLSEIRRIPTILYWIIQFCILILSEVIEIPEMFWVSLIVVFEFWIVRLISVTSGDCISMTSLKKPPSIMVKSLLHPIIVIGLIMNRFST